MMMVNLLRHHHQQESKAQGQRFSPSMALSQVSLVVEPEISSFIIKVNGFLSLDLSWRKLKRTRISKSNFDHLPLVSYYLPDEADRQIFIGLLLVWNFSKILFSKTSAMYDWRMIMSPDDLWSNNGVRLYGVTGRGELSARPHHGKSSL